jgi:hypothetical protein
MMHEKIDVNLARSLRILDALSDRIRSQMSLNDIKILFIAHTKQTSMDIDWMDSRIRTDAFSRLIVGLKIIAARAFRAKHAN